MSPLPPTILTIVGITGDLATRKLLPALRAMRSKGVLPEKFHILGTTRKAGVLVEGCEVVEMDAAEGSDYRKLDTRITEIERKFGESAQRLFYLSVPPDSVRNIIEGLGASGLASGGNAKLMLEKPFGTDGRSGDDLIALTHRFWARGDVYRVDHYLAKPLAEEILALSRNAPLSSGAGVVKIEIAASEHIGIEGRTAFYEQTGALRDVIQSHLLLLTALALIDPDSAGTIQERRLGALQKLRSPMRAERGQYVGYKEEVGNTDSTTETFAAITLDSSDPRIAGIPITLLTGKMMKVKETEIRISYKRESGALEEVIYADRETSGTEAYEKVFLGAIEGNRDLFVSEEEVRETWRITSPVLEVWRKSPNNLTFYEPGENIWNLFRE